jgi:regulator of protease activity HflC (stomatin/prohibitin superfamily)
MNSLAFLLVLCIVAIGYSLRIAKEYERAVVYTLGRYSSVKGPGIFFLTPFVQLMVRVDMRVRKATVSENITSSDNQPFSLEADIYFQVKEADKAINNVADYLRATEDLTRTAMREILRKRTYRQTLDNLNDPASEIAKALNAQTPAWGITVTTVTLRLPGVGSAPVNQPA